MGLDLEPRSELAVLGNRAWDHREQLVCARLVDVHGLGGHALALVLGSLFPLLLLPLLGGLDPLLVDWHVLDELGVLGEVCPEELVEGLVLRLRGGVEGLAPLVVLGLVLLALRLGSLEDEMVELDDELGEVHLGARMQLGAIIEKRLELVGRLREELLEIRWVI